MYDLAGNQIQATDAQRCSGPRFYFNVANHVHRVAMEIIEVCFEVVA